MCSPTYQLNVMPPDLCGDVQNSKCSWRGRSSFAAAVCTRARAKQNSGVCGCNSDCCRSKQHLHRLVVEGAPCADNLSCDHHLAEVLDTLCHGMPQSTAKPASEADWRSILHITTLPRPPRHEFVKDTDKEAEKSTAYSALWLQPPRCPEPLFSHTSHEVRQRKGRSE